MRRPQIREDASSLLVVVLTDGRKKITKRHVNKLTNTVELTSKISTRPIRRML